MFLEKFLLKQCLTGLNMVWDSMANVPYIDTTLDLRWVLVVATAGWLMVKYVCNKKASY